MQGLRNNPLLVLLVAVPAVFAIEHSSPESHTLLFVLSMLAIIPLATLLSHATESVAAKTGDAVGGLLNATLGNLTELVIAITALRAGMFDLVKASIAGAIFTNSLFMLGMALLLGGLKHRMQEYNPGNARLQAGAAVPGGGRTAAAFADRHVGPAWGRGDRATAQRRPGRAAAGDVRARPGVLARHAP